VGIKRDAADKHFSDCVRERAEWTCEYSGLVDPDGQARGVSRIMECAHIYGRRNKNIRWHPFNAFCLSHTAHRYLTENPMEFSTFVKLKLGIGQYDLLLERKNDLSIKYSKEERKKKIPAHYREEFKRLRKLREQGTIGRIEFVGYD